MPGLQFKPRENLCYGSQRCHFTLNSDYWYFQQGRWSRNRRMLSKLILEQPGMKSIIILHFFRDTNWHSGFPDGAVVKNLPTSAGNSRDSGSIPVSGRSLGVRNGNSLQNSCKFLFKMAKEFEQMVYKRQRIANKTMKRYVHQLYLSFFKKKH